MQMKVSRTKVAMATPLKLSQKVAKVCNAFS